MSKPQKYWEVKMKADRVGELLLYGPISDAQFWGDEITPKQIDADLKNLGELDVLNVRINSGGGNVFAGQAIYTMLKRNKTPNKCAYIDGLAASMASLVPLGCNKVIMAGNALQMIHRPYAGAIGTADDLRDRADVLDKIEGIVADIYAEKSGLPREKVSEMMAAETWLTAQEALELGFIDEIENEIQIAASIDGDFLIFGDVKTDTKHFSNFPETYRAALEPLEPVANKKPEPDPETDKPDLSEQVKDFHRLRDKIYKTYEEDN